MSALAKYLIINGFEVSGSDSSESSSTEYLKSLGCNVFIGHSERNVKGQDIIIYNSAIDENNPEMLKAKELRLCILKRVELLQMIISSFLKSVGFSGSHGKTTSTSMLSHILLSSGFGFTSHIGGYDNALGNLYQNGKDVFVTEVCEFNRNINFINCSVAVVLNIDNDHMNCYKDIYDLRDCFFGFLSRAEIPVINIDDELLAEYPRRAVTFAIKKKADYNATVIDEKRGKPLVRFYKNGKREFDIRLKISGEHNVYNALAAFATAKTMKIPTRSIIDGLNSFTGVKRRNELIGLNGNCKVIADYAHHPKEIECSLLSYKKQFKRFFVVFQPHTYTRTKYLFDDFIRVFKNTENYCIFKTYAARETADMGTDADTLAKALKCPYFDSFNALKDYIETIYQKYDAIIILGAGDLYDKVKNKICENETVR